MTQIGSTFGRPPDINLSLGTITSSGHIHWDGNNNFSGTDWLWLRNQKVSGERVRLYVTTGDGTLKQSDWNRARSFGEGMGNRAMPPENFPGVVVDGVQIKRDF